eukprot:GHVU01168268.1.p2 GENE.GHVU01168268.1~~GHVU01168268.1.p2  ORF type:complete len:135 (-),score=17.31 GHVU01168268.1:127-474(-)
MNTTSCPTCTGATCDNPSAFSSDKAKCKDSTECPTACMYYKWITCKAQHVSGKFEKDVGTCVDAEMKKIGCKHGTDLLCSSCIILLLMACPGFGCVVSCSHLISLLSDCDCRREC